MKIKHLPLLVIPLLASFDINAQFKLGIGLEYGLNTLTKVDPNALSPYGHSGYQSNQRSGNTVIPLLFTNYNLYKGLSIETGIGYGTYNHNFDFKYFNTFYGWEADETVTFKTSYLIVPLTLNYDFKMSNSDYIHIGAGVRNKILVNKNDNYSKSIFESIEIITQYEEYIVALYSELGYYRKINNVWDIKASVFATYDTQPFTKEKYNNWGFFENLSPSRLLSYGISLKTYINL